MLMGAKELVVVCPADGAGWRYTGFASQVIDGAGAERE